MHQAAEASSPIRQDLGISDLQVNWLRALVLEMPTTVTILWLNTFIVATPVQLSSGPQELSMNGALLAAHSGDMASAFRPKLKPMWRWEGWNNYFAHEADDRGRTSDTPVRTTQQSLNEEIEMKKNYVYRRGNLFAAHAGSVDWIDGVGRCHV